MAGYDLSLSSTGRIGPGSGAQIEAEGGYGLKLYGEYSKKEPFYGYLRGALKATSSALVNSYETTLSFFPVGFIGLTYGHMNQFSNFNGFSFFPCKTEISCRGGIIRDYLQYSFAIGSGNWFSTVKIKKAKNQYPKRDDNLGVGEFRYVTEVLAKEEVMNNEELVLGLKINSTISYVLLLERNEFEKINRQSYMNVLGRLQTLKSEQFFIGLGNIQSSTLPNQATIIIQWKKFFKRGLSLF